MNDDDLYRTVSDSIAVIRKKFLFICDKDICAAMLLDQFHATLVTSIEHNSYRTWEDDEERDGHTYSTIKGLTEDLFDMFESECVIGSLVLLQNKEYIEVLVDEDEDLGFTDFNVDIACNIENINEAVSAYKAAIKIEEEGEEDDDKEEDSPVEVPETPRPVVLATTISSEEMRAIRITEEINKVIQHNKRAKKFNLPATLTIEEWIAAVDFFNWNCAYCQDRPYTVLEHFIPIVHGGGTTSKNCVPSCNSCNAQKSGWNPLANYGPDLSHMREGLDRVKSYFSCLPALLQEMQ